MGFNDFNEALAAQSGAYVTLNQAGQKLDITLVDVDRREKVYKGEVVYSRKTKKPRIEWLFTGDTPEGETVKWSAGESAQIAIHRELNGRKLARGGRIQVVVTESSVRGEKSAEFKVKYTEPVATFDLPDEGSVEEDPFA